MRPFLCRFALLLLLVWGCGGGAATTGEAKSAAGEEGAQREGAARDADAAESSTDTASTPDKPQGPSCDDGTCSVCGNGICPAGWYCDEKANACSWLTECAEKPSCACVTRVLGGACKCHEEGGAVKVACD